MSEERFQVKNEFSKLRKVILGHSIKMGAAPSIEDAIDPKSKESILQGTYPNKQDVFDEMDAMKAVLEYHEVEVLRPSELSNLNQVFARDLGMVIEDKFLLSEILPERSQEQEALSDILNSFSVSSIFKAPGDVRMEGGDVIVHGDKIFVGFTNELEFERFKTARTNTAAVEFLKELFPSKEIIGLELNKSDKDPNSCTLHLDCTFQPLGLGQVLINKNGFKKESDYNSLKELFGQENVIDITDKEKYHLGTNLFSLDYHIVVSDSRFTRINSLLKELNYLVEAIDYQHVSKMGGLFRCTTLPLEREFIS